MGQITQLPSGGGVTGQVMTKVMSFPSREQAERCLEELRGQQEGQPWYEIQILSIHVLPSASEKQWKVVVGLQFPQESVRAAIIQRKKTRDYYPLQTLLLILELTAQFILLHAGSMCEHLDIYAYIFHSGGDIKICNPRLLYETCSRGGCRREIDKGVIMRQVLQVVLMEKVIQVSQWVVMGKVREIYCSEMLDNLIGNLMKGETDLKVILTEYMQIREDLQQKCISTQHLPIQQEHPETPSFTSEFVAFPFPRAPPETPKKQSGLDDMCQQAIAESIVKEDSSQSYSNRLQEAQEGGMSNRSYDVLRRIPYQPQIRIESSSHQQATSETVELQPQRLFQETQMQESSLSEEAKSMELARVVRQEEQGVFQGYQRDGKKYGRGKFTYREGLVFDGYWLEGKKNGHGSVLDSNGRLCFKGTYKDDLQHGQGQIFNHDCLPLRGPFDYKDLTHIFDDNIWRQYRGCFREDWIDGQGTAILSNGQKFQGSWLKGVAQGRGTFTTVFGSTITGLWSEGVLEKRVSLPSESSISLEEQY